MSVHQVAGVLAAAFKALLTRREEAAVKHAARRADRLADEIDWPPEETTT